MPSKKPVKAAGATNSRRGHDWPGAFGIYRPSRDAMRLNIWPFVGLEAFNILATTLLRAVSHYAIALSWLISIIFSIAITYLLLQSARGRTCSFSEAFERLTLPLFGNMLLLVILVVLALIGSLLLLIVPFFFVLPRLVLATYYLVDQDMSALDAFKASWHATRGHAGKAWGVLGVNILIALLAITIIGIPLAVYFGIMYSAALPLLYLYVSRQKPTLDLPKQG